MNLPAVKSLIPHRGYFLLLEKITSLEGKHVEASGRFTAEHSNPVTGSVMSVFLLEGLAQALACLVALTSKAEGAQVFATPLLVGFDRASFTGKVTPELAVDYKITISSQRHGITEANGVVWQGSERVCVAIVRGTYR